MAQQKTKHASHTKSCQTARTMQASRRMKRLEREHRRITKQHRRAVAAGRPVAGLIRALENVEYAMSYDRTEGKKGGAGMPENLEIPHKSKPFKGRDIKRTHTQVFYRTAHNLGVPHGGYVKNDVFREYIEQKDS